MGQEFIISATESKNLKKENREIPSRMSLENCGFWSFLNLFPNRKTPSYCGSSKAASPERIACNGRGSFTLLILSVRGPSPISPLLSLGTQQRGRGGGEGIGLLEPQFQRCYFLISSYLQTGWCTLEIRKQELLDRDSPLGTNSQTALGQIQPALERRAWMHGSWPQQSWCHNLQHMHHCFFSLPLPAQPQR